MSRRIRVSPEGLRETAGLLRDKQEQLAALENDLLASAGDAPSYEGQFGPKVGSLASEGSASLRAVSADLGVAIEELERIADNFEAADHETLQQLAAFSTGLLAQLDGLLTLFTQFQPPEPETYHLRLDYSLEEFQQMSAEERIAWVEAFNDGPAEGWFHNFEDTVHYFNDSQVFAGLDGSKPAGQWMAWGDAVVLMVVQDGYSLVQGTSIGQLSPLPSWIPESLQDERNTAAQLSSQFFRHYDERPDDTPGLLELWGPAEQAGVNLGQTIGYLQLEQSGVELSKFEQKSIDTFVRFGDVYRWTIGTNSGVEVFEALPSLIGAEVGGVVGEEVNELFDDWTRSEFEEFAGLVSIFAGEDAGDFLVGLGNAIIESPLVDGAVDVVSTDLGEAVGDHWGGRLDGAIEYGGERFFDPRSQWGFEIERSTLLGDFSAELKMRGHIYHVSLTVENMLLNGREDLANRFLEAVEEAARQAGRPDG